MCEKMELFIINCFPVLFNIGFILSLSLSLGQSSYHLEKGEYSNSQSQADKQTPWIVQ